MLLIAEIVLTVLAWRKGWRARALLPVGITFPTALVVGLLITLAGGPEHAPVLVGMLLDVVCVVVLIAMLVRAPTAEALPAPTPVQTVPPVESWPPAA